MSDEKSEDRREERRHRRIKREVTREASKEKIQKDGERRDTDKRKEWQRNRKREE